MTEEDTLKENVENEADIKDTLEINKDIEPEIDIKDSLDADVDNNGPYNNIEQDSDIPENLAEIEKNDISVGNSEVNTASAKEDKKWSEEYEHEELADALKMVDDFSSLLALKNALQTDLINTKDALKKALYTNGKSEAEIKKLQEDTRLTEELRRDLTFVEEERNDAIKKTQDLEFELTSIKAINEKLKKEIEERDDLENTLLNLQERTTSLEREKSAQLEKMEDLLAETTKNKDNAEDELTVITEEHESLKTATETLNKELQISQDAVKQLTYEKNHLQNRIAFLEKEKAELDSKIQQAAKNVRIRENEISVLHRDIIELRGELSESKTSGNKLSKELDVARKSFMELKDKLIHVMGSKELSDVI